MERRNRDSRDQEHTVRYQSLEHENSDSTRTETKLMKEQTQEIQSIRTLSNKAKSMRTQTLVKQIPNNWIWECKVRTSESLQYQNPDPRLTEYKTVEQQSGKTAHKNLEWKNPHPWITKYESHNDWSTVFTQGVYFRAQVTIMLQTFHNSHVCRLLSPSYCYHHKQTWDNC